MGCRFKGMQWFSVCRSDHEDESIERFLRPVDNVDCSINMVGIQPQFYGAHPEKPGTYRRAISRPEIQRQLPCPRVQPDD